jgi:hypothetical protein
MSDEKSMPLIFASEPTAAAMFMTMRYAFFLDGKEVTVEQFGTRVRAASEMLALLRDIEWTDDLSPECPKCLAPQSSGHTVDCPLDALLKRLEE